MLTKLQSHILKFDENKKWFQELVLTKDNNFLTNPLAKEEWSIKEIIEHVTIVEERYINFVLAAKDILPQQNILQSLRRQLVLFVLRNGIKVPVPIPEVVPTGNIEINQLMQRWDSARNKLKKILEMKQESDLNLFVFKHPIAGNLNMLQSIEILTWHLHYHMVRANRLIKKINL